MLERKYAYLAAMIDGEGCLFIGNFSRSKNTYKPYYQSTLSVSNTEEVLIDWLHKNFGGWKSVYTRKQTPNTSRKTVYKWTVSGQTLTDICHAVLPDIVAKKREVEIMLEFRATFERATCKKGHQGTLRLEQEVLDKRQKLFEELRSIHCRTYSHKTKTHTSSALSPSTLR